MHKPYSFRFGLAFVFVLALISVSIPVLAQGKTGRVLAATANAPAGYLDTVSCDTIAGWAYDPDEPSAVLAVHIYKDGPAGSGTFVTSTTTTGDRAADVNSTFGITGTHGFNILTPASLKDGNSHSIYAYGIDSSLNGNNPVLGGSPVSLVCASPAIATPTATLTANGQGGLISVSSGSSVKITWVSTDATSCDVYRGTNIDRGDLQWSDTGNTREAMNITSDTVFRLICSGPGGIASDESTVVALKSPDPLIITTTLPLPNAKVGESYFWMIGTEGGTGTNSWTVSDGFTPPGLSVIDGVVRGTPTTAGTYTFTLTVTSGSLSASKQFTLTVDPAITATLSLAVSLDPATPIAQNINVGSNAVSVLQFKLSAVGGDVIITGLQIGRTGNGCSFSNYKLYMDGVQLGTAVNPDSFCQAVFSGLNLIIPQNASKSVLVKVDVSNQASAGTVAFQLSSLSSSNPQVNISGLPINGYSMTVASAGSELFIATASPLPNAKVGQAYSTTVSASGGTGAYTWQASSGSSSPFPPGLSFAPNACLTCQSPVTITGTPTTAGTYTFTIQVSTSATVSISKQFTLTVEPAIIESPTITVTSPAPNASWIRGQYHTVSWTFSGISDTGEDGDIRLSSAAGKIIDVPVNLIDGTYNLLPPADFPLGDAKLYVLLSKNQNVFGMVQGYINITDKAPAENQKPFGWIDSVSTDGFVSGWAVDQDHLDVPINIHVYFDSPAGSGGIPMAQATDVQRDDVNLIMSATGTHGFKIAIPNNLRDGKNHVVYIYGIDLDDSSGLSNVSLWGSPKSFSIGSTNNPIRHPRGTVVIGEGATVYFLGAEIRYPFPSPEIFFSWGHQFSELVLANSADLAMPIGPTVEIKQ